MKNSPKKYGRWQALKKFLAFSALTILCNFASAGDGKNQLVRLARLQIDPARLESYKNALSEEIKTSLEVEPGVLTLYAVSEKLHPERITILEIYADSTAYKSHLQTPHFIKYKNLTRDMVKSLELVETVPVLPGVKLKGR